ncbi:C-type mannose receptor 2-like [Engraulis encrasicolus]|uniref:C-type mannose receptor 2-like n=1 Tax=Engraulis encrasicolus TaxID=184585 RepID=UPI002FD107EA
MGIFLLLMLLFPAPGNTRALSHSRTILLTSDRSYSFHVVKEGKTWAAAQQYCREEFTDLATIDNMAQIDEIKREMQDAGVGAGWRGWIGLKQGRSWQWSLADTNFYEGNEAEFRNWNDGEPNGWSMGQECVGTEKEGGGQWHDLRCPATLPFICYNGADSSLVLINEAKNWTEAQKYCREKHTDLASVRNQTENDQIRYLISGLRGVHVWIGLFRDAWEWSDGSSSSFRHWERGEPNYGGDNPQGFCVEMKSRSGQWNDHSCDQQKGFICYEDKLVLVRENKTWMDAMQYCRQHHVDLVSVTSEKIQRWVEGWAKAATSPHVWLGLSYHRSLGFWSWVNGYSVSYDNFASNADRMPGWDTAGGAVRRDGGQWVSFQETKQLNFICTDEDLNPLATVQVVSPQSPFYAGDVVTLRCDITDYRDWLQYVWLKDSTPVPDQTSLTINITLPLEADLPNATVEVVSPPPPFYSGDVVTLRCDIPEYSDWHQHGWLKDGTPIPGMTSETITITLPQDAAVVKRTQLVRVEMEVSDDMDMEDPDLQKAFLQQIGARLKAKGVRGDVKLSWRKQPDGKVFHKKKNDKKKEKRDEL